MEHEHGFDTLADPSYPCSRMPLNDTVTFEWAVRGVGIVMASLSIIGAALIIGTFLKWSDMRTMSRRLLVFISIADLLTAIGNLLGLAGNLDQLVTSETKNLSDYVTFHPPLCVAQSFVTTTSSLSSFFWTCILAWYLYLSLVHMSPNTFRQAWHTALMHFIGWGIPLACGIAAIVKGALGADADIAASAGWCFIRGHSRVDDSFTYHDKMVWQLMVGKAWEILTYVIMLLVYLRIKYFIYKNTEHQTIVTAGALKATREADRKFTLVPVIFVAIRIWGTIRFFLSLSHDSCSATDTYLLTGRAFLLLQSAGDSSQAFANCILFVFMTKKIRRRLLKVLLCGRHRKAENRDSVDDDDERRPIMKFSASGRRLATRKTQTPSVNASNQRVYYGAGPPLSGAEVGVYNTVAGSHGSTTSVPKDFLGVGGGVFVDPPRDESSSDDDDDDSVSTDWVSNSHSLQK